MQYSLLALIAAIIPTAVYFWIATRFVRTSSETKSLCLVATIFLWGAIPAIGIAMAGNRFFNRLMDYDVNVGLTTEHQASAAVVILGVLQPALEETLKALPLLFVFLVMRRHYQSVTDGMFYSAIVGLGFGIAENYQYIHGAAVNSGIPIMLAVAVTRSVIFGLAHTIWSTPFAIGLGVARRSASNASTLLAPIIGLVLGVLIHGLHNASFLWAGLQRSYGVSAVVVSLAIYGIAYVTWMVLAFRSARRRSTNLLVVASEDAR